MSVGLSSSPGQPHYLTLQKIVYNDSYQIYGGKWFLPSCSACLLTAVIVSSDVQKFLVFHEDQFTYFSFAAHAFGITTKIQGHGIDPSIFSKSSTVLALVLGYLI